MIRKALLALSRSTKVKNLATSLPVTASVVANYVPGEGTAAAVKAVEEILATGRTATLDFLGEDTLEPAQAEATVRAYVELLEALAPLAAQGRAEVSVKLSAIGQALPGDGERRSLENARLICNAARNAGTTVTLDMEDHTTTDSTLRVLAELRKDFPETGCVLQSYLYRTEDDARALAVEGSRVRLCKGAYAEPSEVAYPDRLDVDKAYVRCAQILLDSPAYPMLATHDPRLIEICTTVAEMLGRAPGSFEFQMLYGIRPDEQARLISIGHALRVYVPYGVEWYGYLVRRLAERPSNLALFLRSLVSSS